MDKPDVSKEELEVARQALQPLIANIKREAWRTSGIRVAALGLLAALCRAFLAGAPDFSTSLPVPSGLLAVGYWGALAVGSFACAQVWFVYFSGGHVRDWGRLGPGVVALAFDATLRMPGFRTIGTQAPGGAAELSPVEGAWFGMAIAVVVFLVLGIAWWWSGRSQSSAPGEGLVRD